MSGRLAISFGPAGPQVEAAPPLPIEALVLGKPAHEAADLLPRIFNLCPMAQATAIRLALDLPLPDPAQAAQEIARDHRLKLQVIWPRFLGVAGCTTPLPRPADLDDWLARQPLFATIARLFPPGCAVADLPAVTPETAMNPAACENSAAGRRADHPTLAAVAARWGKGPLWRAVARLADLDPPPAPRRLADGAAVVPAARGLYAVQARTEAGRITAFRRVTPTDHLAAPGGVLHHSLASLPADGASLAPLLLAILDPCVPVTFHEAAHA